MSTYGNNLLAQYYAQNQGLPFGYEAVEYLESHGGSYIDVGIKWGTYDWEVEFTCIGNVRFGVVHQNVVSGTWNHLASSTSSGSSYFWRNYYSRYNFNTIPNNATIKISCQTGLYIDGVKKNNNIFSAGTDATLNINMLLFANYDFYKGGAETYSEKHNDFVVRRTTGETIRDFIPCVRKSDNKPGMYDLCRSICPLTGTSFYVNAGTGEFTTP